MSAEPGRKKIENATLLDPRKSWGQAIVIVKKLVSSRRPIQTMKQFPQIPPLLRSCRKAVNKKGNAP